MVMLAYEGGDWWDCVDPSPFRNYYIKINYAISCVSNNQYMQMVLIYFGDATVFEEMYNRVRSVVTSPTSSPTLELTHDEGSR